MESDNTKQSNKLDASSSILATYLGHDSHTLGVNGTQVGILKESDKVRLGSFLQSKNGRALEAEVGLEILGDLSHKTLEWQLANEEVGGLLVTTNLAEGD